MAEHDARTAGLVERRTVLLGAGAVGAAGLLAACGGSESDDAGTSASETPPASGGGAESSPGSDNPAAVAQAEDVPVGGGVIVADKQIVVTQPSAGDYRAFTSICTHQGCTVTEVTDTEIICPCHGSRFSATSGEVLAGPATVGLAEVPVAVEGGSIVSQA